MRNLLGLFLVLLLLNFCIAEEDDVPAESDEKPEELENRAPPKGCKRKNDWRKKPKFYKKGRTYFKDCIKYTCTEPRPRKFAWAEELDTQRCCSFNRTLYPIGSKILCKDLPDECTKVCLECLRVEAKATMDLVVEDDCPERPPETKVITEVPYDIISPKYPDPYPPKQDMCWSWTPKCGNSAYLEFYDFDVLGHDAYVTIKPPINGKSKFWGNKHNPANLPPKTTSFPCDTAVMICFKSGKIVNGHKGFNATINDKPCSNFIHSPNYENVEICDETPPPHGYGLGIDHCDVRASSAMGQTMNMEFCQFDTPDPLDGDYLTIHPNPTDIPKYYGPSLDAAEAPPKWTEYPGVRYLTVCFKSSSVPHRPPSENDGYLAEIYETGVSTTMEQGSETWEYSSSYDYSYYPYYK